MQVQKINKEGTDHWVLLDDNMHLISPVCEFLEFQRKIERAGNTLRAYALDLKIYWEFLEERCLDYREATVDVMGDFVDELHRLSPQTGRSRSNRSINRMLSSVHRFYRYEQMRGICKNPIFFEVIPETGQMYQGVLTHTRARHQTQKSIFKLKETKGKVHIVSEAEMECFLGELRHERDRLLFALLYETGARIQEALDLEISMLPQPRADQPVGVFRQIRSKGKRRDLYAPMYLIFALHRYVQEIRQKDPGRVWLFAVEKGAHIGEQLSYHAAYDMMQRTEARLGLHFTFHDLRHSFCTRLIEQGLDVGLVQQVMGHANLYTTKCYVHPSDRYLCQCMSDYWSGAKPFESVLCPDGLGVGNPSFGGIKVEGRSRR